MLLDDGHGVKSVLLGEFGLDLGEDGSQVRDILVAILLVSKEEEIEVSYRGLYI